MRKLSALLNEELYANANGPTRPSLFQNGLSLKRGLCFQDGLSLNGGMDRSSGDGDRNERFKAGDAGADPRVSGRHRRCWTATQWQSRATLRVRAAHAGAVDLSRAGPPGEVAGAGLSGPHDGFFSGAAHATVRAVRGLRPGPSALQGTRGGPAAALRPRRVPGAGRTRRAARDAVGPATVHLCRRAWQVYGDARYEQLATISVAHLYNLRATPVYRQRRVRIEKTRTNLSGIGVRKAPDSR